jgi:hypothetical protein
MRRKFKLFAVLVCLLVLACGASTVSYRIIDQGVAATGPYASPHFRIISEALAFNNAFKALHATQLPQPKLPAVDFATTAVLVVALGQQPSTGYRVEVERIERQGEMLNVNLQLTTPSPDAARATVMTSPYIVIEVSKQPSWKIVKFFDQEQKLLAELDASK